MTQIKDNAFDKTNFSKLLDQFYLFFFLLIIMNLLILILLLSVIIASSWAGMVNVCSDIKSCAKCTESYVHIFSFREYCRFGFLTNSK